MVRQLQGGQADICIAGLTVTPARSEVVDFTVGILEDVISLLIANPAVVGKTKSEVNFVAYVVVFTGRAWLAVLGVALLSSAAHALSLRWTAGGTAGGGLVRARHFASGMRHFLLSLIQRGPNTGESAQYAGGMIFLLTTSIVSYFLFSFYVGDLTASMTVGAKTSRIKNFQDVIDAGYDIHAQEGTSHYGYLRNAKEDSMAHEVYKHHLSHKTAQEYATEQLKDPPKAALFASHLIVLLHKHLLFLRNFDDSVSTQLAIGLQDDSEFREVFNHQLIKLHQTGVLNLLAHKWLKDDEPDDWSHRIFQEEAWPLGYENLLFLMLVLITGVSCSAFILCVEVLLKCTKVN